MQINGADAGSERIMNAMLKVYGFAKVNAMARGHTRAQIPAINDDDLVPPESAAIRLYLATKSCRLHDLVGEAQVMRWCFAAMSAMEVPLLSLLFVDWMSGGDARDAKGRTFLADWSKRALGNLERWLEGQQFVATESFTVAAILMAHVLEGARDESLLRYRPNVVRYRERCFGRAAWRKVLDAYMGRVEAV